MTKKNKTTPKGDRQRHCDAVRSQTPRKAMYGNHIRVRGVRRAEIDTTKLSLAIWLIAKGAVDQVEDNSGAPGADESKPTEEPQ